MFGVLKMRSLICIAVLLLAGPAYGQQQMDAAFTQRALDIVRAQRNQAQDMAAVQQARADSLTEQLAAAKAELEKLKPETAK